MERKNAWTRYDDDALDRLEGLAAGYIDFISENKTEREITAACIQLAEEAGYRPLDRLIKEGLRLKAGDRVWAHNQDKALMLVQLGRKSMQLGLNILGAHIDSPRLDVKQNPLYESSDFVLLDTHYYGGIKKYQWVTLPLALHGVVVKSDGVMVDVCVGEDPYDPVFCITDILPHLGAQQMEKKAAKIVEGEDLDLLIGSRPEVPAPDDGEVKKKKKKKKKKRAKDAAKNGEAAKKFTLKLLEQKYGIREEDFVSAELEVVPAGRARELGFDRSMVIGYGQDDSVCAYTSLLAQLDAPERIDRTAVTLLVDKEEIGSVGASGMTSRFFENVMSEILVLADGRLSGKRAEVDSSLAIRRCLASSRMLSSDVSAGFDPLYPTPFETKNAAYLGYGMVFNKYTGARGKSGSNDARAEYMAQLRRLMEDAGVCYQTSELGKVDAGGGGTIAYIPAEYGMDVIDSGVPVLSMHSPWEVTSKADIFEAYKGYVAFLASV